MTNKKIKELISDSKINITQGFIGSDSNNFTVTLGREGSIIALLFLLIH